LRQRYGNRFEASGGGIFTKVKGKNVPVINMLREEEADRSLPLPSYESVGAAGADLRANLKMGDRQNGIAMTPMARVLVPTGLRLEIPEGYEMQIRPRSGLSFKHGITLVNAPGTIDSDYRGPLGVLLVNLGTEPYIVRHGDRIAQAVVAPVVQAEFNLTEELSETGRGAGGFGSTGRS